MSDFKLDSNTFEQVLKSMNLKATFYSAVIAQESEERDDAALGKWLRQYVADHKKEAAADERQIWD